MSSAAGVRIAIIGCGAVTELGYAPAIKRARNAHVTLLVDIDAKRRQLVCDILNVEHTNSNFDECYDLFDAAIVALPHAMHAPVSIKLLSQGKAVLVEKPMGLSVAECDAMIEAAERGGVPLAVGLVRRFLWSNQFVSSLINDRVLGKLQSFDIREGSIYNWPVASDFFFRKESAGGGVLIDTGAHTLDSLLHWLGDFSEAEYFDDAQGGVEANCLLNLRLANGTSGVVELSRTRTLRNTAIIRGELGTIEVALGSNDLKLMIPPNPYSFEGSVQNPQERHHAQDYLQLMTSQVEDFVAAVTGSRTPKIDGRSARLSIRLIESCYRHRMPLQLAWQQDHIAASG